MAININVGDEKDQPDDIKIKVGEAAEGNKVLKTMFLKARKTLDNSVMILEKHI